MEPCNFSGKGVLYKHFEQSLEQIFAIFNTLTVTIRIFMKI